MAVATDQRRSFPGRQLDPGSRMGEVLFGIPGGPQELG
jgi:hypothetical protein